MIRMLTISQAAEVLGLNPETLRRWDRNGKLKAIRINKRGDRRYKKSDLLALLDSKGDFTKYSQIIEHEDYFITWHTQGFERVNGNFSFMAQFVVKKDQNDFIGFIFYVPALSASIVESKDLIAEITLNKLKEHLFRLKPVDGSVFTFEFDADSFLEVHNPEWWNEKYSKILAPKLRVVASHSSMVSSKKKAWKVVLHFEHKSGDFWVSNMFGNNRQFHEYFVWISSQELISRRLANTLKSAELVAVRFGANLFEETKNEHGDKDLRRIQENNSACFDGKVVKNMTLLEEA